ncbi:LLM class F420-dependent oxidoreductase [Amycolatopsis aidingensis]|uniref:LLM class F420-dependent oxidoreductase n=1 Tax=Amycolatopsis aidingensis TaxID=2842453 RepID=UPI001C0C05D4|nr:LLM class F420-dependent oxidoreductase [Amycolatopsis aidingensis]
MKFGATTFVTADGIRPDRLGPALEERGFDSLFIAEHSHIPASRESPYPMGGELPGVYYRSLDPFVALTAAAGTTTDLRLGTGIALLVQRDTIHTAKEVASLDTLSGGRVIFGVGVGWNKEEMRNHGTDPRTRGALMDEQLEALKIIWREEQAEYHGKYVDFDPIFSWPKPVQRPHPPIYIGGNSPAALARVATHGDGWLPFAVSDPAEIRPQLDLLAEHTEKAEVTVSGVDSANRAVIDGYAEAGVQRATFVLRPQPEGEVLRQLDGLAEIVAAYR